MSLIRYKWPVIEVRTTAIFDAWLRAVRSGTDRAIIAKRVARLARGLFGNAQPVGEGILELRLHNGPGYRVYLLRRGDTIVVLLCGGDKGSQDRDIAKAKALAREERG